MSRNDLSTAVVILICVGTLLLVPIGVEAETEDEVAESPVPEDTDPLREEITVTARQTEEAVRDVPATVSVLTDSTIEAIGVTRPEDFIKILPGVSMVNAAEVGDTQVNIRGINGSRDAENSFAFIVDGILMTNPAAFNREYGNLRQIAVMKGPQGAIYGRNAAAGAVIVSTHAPTDEFKAEVRVSAAEDSTYYGAALFGGPVGDSGKAGYQIQADWRSTDGFYFNSFQQDAIVDDFANFNLSGRLTLEPSESTSWDLKARYGEVDAAAITFNAAFALPTFASVLATPEFFENVNDHEFVFQGNIDPQNDQTALELSAKVEHRFDWANLTAWVLYSDIDNTLSADGTSGAFGFFNAEENCRSSTAELFAAGVTLPAPQFLGPVPEFSLFGPYTPTTCDGTQLQKRNQEDLSIEARLSGGNGERLRWQGGVYYLDIDREVGVNLGIDRGLGVSNNLFVPQDGDNPTEQLAHDRFESEVFAVFGSTRYDLSDAVELSVALRYDREKRSVTNLVPTDARTQFIDYTLDGEFNGNAPLNPGLDPNINPDGVILPKSETFDEVEPKISMTWDVNDRSTLYGSWGVGFKSGGFNNQGSNATVELFYNDPLGTDLLIEDLFEKETSSAFEVGFKSDLTPRLTFDAALYKMDVDDMQFFEFLVGPFGLLRVVSNIDQVDIQGFEVGLGWRATDRLNIYAGYNLTDSEIKANSSRPDTVGNKSPYTPDYTGNLAADFSLPVSDRWVFLASAYLNLVGETWFHTVQENTQTTLFNLGFPGLGTANYSETRRDAYALLDVRLGLSTEAWTATLFGTNLTNEEFIEEAIPAPEFGGSFLHPGTRRRFGLEIAYRF